MGKVKFKAWDGFKIIDSGDFWIDAEGNPAIFNDEGQIKYTHWELIQFAGLTDKNGIEIFDRDILRGRDWSGQVTFKAVEVRFRDGAFCVCYENGDSNSLHRLLRVNNGSCWEVIGSSLTLNK